MLHEVRSKAVEGAGMWGLDQSTELMAELVMGGGAVRSLKAGEATSAKSVEGRMAARESEGSSSTPSIEDLERVERG